MPIYLLQSDVRGEEAAAVEAALKANIPELREAVSVDVLGKSASGFDDPVIVIAILAADDGSELKQLVDFALRHNNEMFLILDGGEISVSE